MANIFTLENFDDFSEKVNIDELYEKKRQHDLNQLALYNKLLNRVHVRIKTTSRLNNDFFCWYVVPEVVIGVPKYDQGACIAYLLNKLKDNGFNVRYIHPNTLFISWLHWVPGYVRAELKSKTGIVVNEFGVKQEEIQKIENEEGKMNGPNGTNGSGTNGSGTNGPNKKKNYTPIQSYKPSGNLIYDNDLLNKIEEKIQK
jgi:hypothetical protein